MSDPRTTSLAWRAAGHLSKPSPLTFCPQRKSGSAFVTIAILPLPPWRRTPDTGEPEDLPTS
jgi:hypothetical protein